MSDQKSLQSVVKKLEDVQSELRNEDQSIDAALSLAASAIDLYRSFKKSYGNSTFDVQTVNIKNEKLVLASFDWKALG